MSTIKTGTTLTTAYQVEGDTTGALVIQTGSTPTTAATFDSSQNTTVAGNLTLSGTGKRITGDFSNATVANRVAFQTSTVDGGTSIEAIPNGTGSVASFRTLDDADPTNASFCDIRITRSNDARLTSSRFGTGTYLPMTFYTGGLERMRIDTSGNVGIGTSSPSYKLDVSGETMRVGNSTAYAGLQFGANATATNNFHLASNAGALIFYNGNYGAGSERMRIASNGDLTLRAGGSANATHVFYYNENGGEIQLMNASGATDVLFDSINGVGRYLTFNGGMEVGTIGAHALVFRTSNAERARIDSSGQMWTTNGAGSLSRAYDCRAWVNFNGTGTVAIRASGNVSSITDNGTGNYTVNITTAMPDANYSATASGQRLMTGDNAAARAMMVQDFSTSSFRIDSISPSNTPADAEVVCATLIR